MAGLDSVNVADNTQVPDPGTSGAIRLSQEANAPPDQGPAPDKPAAPPTPGAIHPHVMHAGGENQGLKEPGPPPPGPIQHDDLHAAGIDVSQFQNTIDWSQVAKDGVQFAFIRATDGTTLQDTTFKQNWQGAEANGIPVGAYHYLTTTSPVATQITNFVNTVKGVDAANLPPVLDIEDPSQWQSLTVQQRIDNIQQWLDGVQQQLGVKPMVYMSSNFASQVLGNTTQFDSYRLYVADYTTNTSPIVPTPWQTWDFWQHADNGQVSGIPTDVDLDYFNGPVSTLPITTAPQVVAAPKKQ